MTVKSASLLIVDADQSVRDHFAAIGRMVGFVVAKAIDTQEMKRKMSSFSPTHILLGLNGCESDIVGRLMLLNDLKSDATVTFLCGMDWTSLRTAKDVATILGLKTGDTIQKPVTDMQVHEKLERLRETIVD